MKKSLLTAIVMALILFVYGYILSTAGHDHSSHSKSSTDKMENQHTHEHSDHERH